MTILYRDWFNVARGDEFRVVPLGDVHIGNAACDERLFKNAIQRIADDPACWWVGLGDYCDFIQRNDPRFSVASLAPWIKMRDLADLAKAQRERFVELVKPIAGKCLGMIEGNHERSILKHYERAIYSEIVAATKEAGGFPADHSLALDYAGWLVLRFYRAEDKQRATIIKCYLHHGFGSGRLAGGAALNLQRWLWTHDADLVLFGHTHKTQSTVECMEAVSGRRVVEQHRRGAVAGTFLGRADYGVEKGFLPAPQTYIEVLLKPGVEESRDRVRIVT